MPSGLRLVQVVPTLFAGGLERVATHLALAVAPAVERLVVATAGGEPHESTLRAAGVELARIVRPRPEPVELLRAAISLAPVLREVRPHVIHAHNPAASAAAALARRLARVPESAIVSTYHGVTPARLGRAGRALRGTADLVVGVGPTTTRALVDAGFPADRALTIFNAVEVAAEQPAAVVRAELGAGGGPLIVNVARYFTEKNQRLLLDALTLLDRPYRAVLVGNGPLEDELRARVTELGLEERVLITGMRSDAIDMIAAADVFVLSSVSEALPLVLIEAMSVGTPVVTTDVGGVRDVVEPGESGLLVASGDAQGLAGAIGRILDEPGLAASLAAGGRRVVDERCSLAKMVEQYRSAYEQAINSRAARRTRSRRDGPARRTRSRRDR